jgi:hypothetical protein
MFQRRCCPLKLIDSNIGCLLFADDLLILSETKEGLQHSLNNLSNYCDNWQLDINVNKTKDESPCLTPLEMLKKTECLSLCLKDDVVLRYCSFNNLKKCNPTPIFK